jgi:multiple sugar transport system ATP-binding protein
VADIEFEAVAKVYADGTRAVDGLDLQIENGEFMVFVGPSGCGKTTALRMVAGLEEISEGAIRIGERVVNGVSPKDRDIAMVFQTYALYPHMTVEENLAFGLKLRRLTKLEIARRVHDAAETLGLEEFLQRKPRALSGGQRQRVAMGRAIVREPQAYLMDEPLSNLDAKLRVQMRAEIHKLQRELGVTTIYVTHDQTEAMTMGDRVAVMRSGHLQQVADPQTLYDRPVNIFVAGFIGSPAMNMVDARLERDGDDLVVRFGPYRLVVDAGLAAERPALVRYREVVLGIRPEGFEDAAFTTEAPPGRTLEAIVGLREALGSEVLVHFSVAGPADASEFIESESILVARVHPQSRAREGEPLRLVVDTRRLHFFDPETGAAIYAG